MYQFQNKNFGFAAWKAAREGANGEFSFRHFHTPFFHAPLNMATKTFIIMKKLLFTLAVTFFCFSSYAQSQPFLSEVSYWDNMADNTLVKVALGIPKNFSGTGYKLVIAVQVTNVTPASAQKISAPFNLTPPNIAGDTLRESGGYDFDFVGLLGTSGTPFLTFIKTDKIQITLLDGLNAAVFSYAFNGVPSGATYSGTTITNAADEGLPNSIQLLPCGNPCTSPNFTILGVQAYFSAGNIQTLTPSKLDASLAVAIKNAAVVLPVSFTTFTGKNISTSNVLNWTTASETNNDYFEVQKLLPDHSTYVTIGRVKGGGTTKSVSSYEFTDPNPGPITYYRIASYDVGLTKIASSATVSVECEKCSFRKYWYAGGQLLTNGEIEPISIADIAGRVMYRGLFKPDIALLSGVYIVNGQKIIVVR